eukprot:UN02731
MYESVEMIISKYKTVIKHKELFIDWKEDWFDPEFWKAYKNKSLSKIVKKLHKDIYIMPMFTEKFCKMLLEELDNFKKTGLPAARPNSMNNYSTYHKQIWV